ncbi:LacI family transcriptional regulator [Friedmanniella endophytica]|uniref:LacI family transcriptional regulator n=1 Tax=Microlunatus kandeliicorticis TaxID=1759536 RepID=A0A7W3IP10_9ACTN|nr:LacI family DNA-binding transcriptional regulator [Microlunatus kandeliicorticis]MBA8792577.1 LacI family transcriptional regulator [Microlunatus kandeliicorticis]
MSRREPADPTHAGATADGEASVPPPSGPAGSPTLEQVAREAGVSLATASRALNGSTRNVRPEYRERVLAAARRLDYSPNLAAQAVAKGGSLTVALVVADITDPYFSSITSGVLHAAEELGLITTLAITERQPERESVLVRVLRGQRPKVIIVAGSRTGSAQDDELAAELAAFGRNGGRVALISQPSLPFRTVDIQNGAGAAALAERMIQLGYRSPAVLSGPAGLATARERTAGFVDTFAAHGHPVPEDRIIPGEFTRNGGFLAAEQLRRRGLSDVDLVFAVNDVMAVGAMVYLRDVGVAVPRDVAVAGFDDIDSLRDVTPSLTTVALPLAQIGRAAVELALRDDEDGADPARLPIEGAVMVRESTPPRDAP